MAPIATQKQKEGRMEETGAKGFLNDENRSEKEKRTMKSKL